jgi:hypothetical protein
VGLCRIKTCLGIEKIVGTVHQLYGYTKEEIVGRIEDFTTETYASIKDPAKLKRFYSLKSLRDDLGMTVIIKGTEQEREVL